MAAPVRLGAEVQSAADAACMLGVLPEQQSNQLAAVQIGVSLLSTCLTTLRLGEHTGCLLTINVAPACVGAVSARVSVLIRNKCADFTDSLRLSCPSPSNLYGVCSENFSRRYSGAIWSTDT